MALHCSMSPSFWYDDRKGILGYGWSGGPNCHHIVILTNFCIFIYQKPVVFYHARFLPQIPHHHNSSNCLLLRWWYYPWNRTLANGVRATVYCSCLPLYTSIDTTAILRYQTLGLFVSIYHSLSTSFYIHNYRSLSLTLIWLSLQFEQHYYWVSSKVWEQTWNPVSIILLSFFIFVLFPNSPVCQQSRMSMKARRH